VSMPMYNLWSSLVLFPVNTRFGLLIFSISVSLGKAKLVELVLIAVFGLIFP